MTINLSFRFCTRFYSIQFRMGMFLFTLFFSSLFCILGIWQLYRYAEKKELLLIYQKHSREAAVLFQPLETVSPFQHIIVEGKYRNELTMLVQDPFSHHQMGFDVLTPFQIRGDKKLILINRGWIKKLENQAIAVINPIDGEKQITGRVKLLGEYQFILGKNILEPSVFPLIMQKVDINEISRLTHQTFYSFVVRLDPEHQQKSSIDASFHDEPIVVITPERHMGYAIQWFIMAFVLLIAYLFFCCERVHGKK